MSFAQQFPLLFPGLAADVVYLEQQFHNLEAVPTEHLRNKLEELHVVLPPRVGRASVSA